MAKFQKGNAGKPKGAKNKITRTVKDHVLDVFNELQEDPKANMAAWARKQPFAFYQIAAKLIPTEVKSNLNVRVVTVIPPKFIEDGNSGE